MALRCKHVATAPPCHGLGLARPLLASGAHSCPRSLATTQCRRSQSRSNIISQAAEPSTQATAPAAAPSFLSNLRTQDKLVFFSSAALCVSNMDKVNISIAIIPMAQEFGWGAAETGIIQSSFFAGYLLMNLPGGYLASRLGGRRTLPIGLATWSLATALAPLAGSVSGLGFSRAMVGLGQAVAPTSIVDMVARTVRKEERASAVSLAFAGLHVGSIVGLLAAPVLIEASGWRALFIVFGAAGLLWYLGFEALMQDIYRNDPEIANKLTTSMTESKPAVGDAKQEQAQVPYRAFIRSRPVQALCLTHFANNWMHYTMLAWLPSYFKEVLDLQDLGAAAHTSIFPPLAGILCSVLAGPVADKLIAAGTPLPVVRKVMQSLAMMGPAACLAAASISSSGDGDWVVPLVTVALGLSSFSLAGLYCTHSDMSPRYAGAMLGVTNTTGAIAGVLSVSAVGVIKDITHSWDAALIIPNIMVLTAGTLAYTVFCRNSPIDFDAEDNSPFAFEKFLEGPKKAALAVQGAVQGAFGALEKLAPQPPQELVQAARRTRLVNERNEALAAAAAAAASMDVSGEKAVTAFASASMMASAPTSSRVAPSFASLVTSSISGFRESEGASGNSNAMLVSQWTMATMIPDFEQPTDTWEDAELSDAEEEVAKIMEQMRNQAEAEAVGKDKK